MGHKIQQVLCFFFGHSYFKAFEDRDDVAVWGYNKCQRCGYEDDWQYAHERRR